MQFSQLMLEPLLLSSELCIFMTLTCLNIVHKQIWLASTCANATQHSLLALLTKVIRCVWYVGTLNLLLSMEANSLRRLRRHVPILASLGDELFKLRPTFSGVVILTSLILIWILEWTCWFGDFEIVALCGVRRTSDTPIQHCCALYNILTRLRVIVPGEYHFLLALAILFSCCSGLLHLRGVSDWTIEFLLCHTLSRRYIAE